MTFKKNKKAINNFSEVTISLASPESILDRSYGEVVQPETINYRTYKPEIKGLFCEKIFGPIKDWECHCGKYKRIRYKEIICDRCGVEVTEKKVRRERMGHIELVVPIAHIWYFRSLPNKIGYLLGLSAKKLDQIIYYERYVIIQPGIKSKDGLNYMDFLTEEEYLDVLESIPYKNFLLSDSDNNKFIAKMGAEALEIILSKLDLDKLSIDLRYQISNNTSQQKKNDILKRLKIVESFRDSRDRIGNRPEWMIIKMVPVIPPELRPLVPLEGGKFATSDINDLYRRVVIRNNRLKRLIDIKAPEVILRNEKRMLQESVDALFDNSRRVNNAIFEGNRPLKSLSEMLKGKQGRFRQNLLGKRVDYSGRSVIVVGPNLKLHECGIPKDMASELFKPFIIRKLLERGIVKTVKSAKKFVDKKESVIWDILENILKGHPVLLNRAPTLHRLGIQAFQPKLIEGKSIQLHPLVCTAFNADFDGDMMAVHIPLSQEAIVEASILMLSSHNILNPANGLPITVPSKDMILGLYYLTKGRKSSSNYFVKGENMIFSDIDEVIIAVNNDELSEHANIKVRVDVLDTEKNILVKKIIDTVAGRVIFNKYVPKGIGFINSLLSNKKLQIIISDIYRKSGIYRTSIFLDDIKDLGFYYSFKGGLSIALDDIKIPLYKDKLIDKAKKNIDVTWNNYLIGLITDNERYNQVIDIWTRINTEITDLLMNELENDQDGFNSIYMMMHSGARGSREQIRQLGGMRGLMAKPQKTLKGSIGEIIENPIISNFKEGLDVIEYFISTHGARKGLADTALKTADAGYLTRRLVDVAQDIIITEADCGTLRGLIIKNLKNNDNIDDIFFQKILGRFIVSDIYNDDNTLISSSEEITEDMFILIKDLKEIEVRSVLTCETKRGICSKCYGRNLSTNKLVHIGEAVGVIAAQSIGEPGTQLTLRTFHVGGAASSTVTESKINSKFDGIVSFEDINYIETDNTDYVGIVMGRSGEIKILDPKTKSILTSHHIPYGAYLNIKDNSLINKGFELFSWDPYNALILSSLSGKIKFESIEEDVTYREEYDDQTGHKEKIIIDPKDKSKNPVIIVHNDKDSISYNLPLGSYVIVEENDIVSAGQILVKIPRIITKSRDITGGLPRVTELFEARNPSNPAIVSEIDGIINYGEIKRGNREIFVKSKSGIKKKYLISLSKHILVQDNDYIKAGYPLSDGLITPADILSIKGPKFVQEYLVNEIQNVYKLQGVRINDKHIEIIVRQMMQKVEIIESGDTSFLPGQVVDRFLFKEENNKILNKKIITNSGDSQFLKLGQIVNNRVLYEENFNLKRLNLKSLKFRNIFPSVSKPKLQGITQAALGTESFISAASFQETTKVLSEAAIQGKKDRLRGLKENVIVGQLIPAGSGLKKYNKLVVSSKKEYNSLFSYK